MVLVVDVKVLIEGTAGHEASPLLNADAVPWSVEVVGKSALI